MCVLAVLPLLVDTRSPQQQKRVFGCVSATSISNVSVSACALPGALLYGRLYLSLSFAVVGGVLVRRG